MLPPSAPLGEAESQRKGLGRREGDGPSQEQREGVSSRQMEQWQVAPLQAPPQQATPQASSHAPLQAATQSQPPQAVQ